MQLFYEGIKKLWQSTYTYTCLLYFST